MFERYSDEVIENLRSHYYTSIIMLYNEEDILKELPEPQYDSFFPVIDGLIELLKKDIVDYQNCQEEFGEEALEEIKLLKFKIELCENRKKEALSLINEETECLQSDKIKNLIFATTSAGNIYFEHDLKDIPEEFYDLILESLEDLYTGNISKNKEKAKGFIAEPSLVGLYELKNYQMRLIYRVLDSDTFYVIQVREKRNNFSKFDRDTLVDRRKKTEIEFKKLKELLKDPDEKEKVVLYNNKIRDKLLLYLEENKRGEKRNAK